MLKPYSEGDFHPKARLDDLSGCLFHVKLLFRKETVNVYVLQIHITMVDEYTNLCIT
jgi:hypothetical protein